MVTLASLAYPIIKAGCPSAKVIGPALLSDPYSADDGMLWGINYLSQGGNAYTDILAFHFYPAYYSLRPMPAEQAIVDAQRYQNLAAAFGISEVWNGEGGYKVGVISDTAEADYVIKSIAILHGAGIDRSFWYAYDQPSFGYLWGGSGQTLNASGVAYKLLEQWYLDATPVSDVARQVSANSVRNTTASGAVSGMPGTLPTHWSLDAYDVTHGITTTVTVGTGYVDFRIFGTPTARALDYTTIHFEDNATISCNGAGQQWWGSFEEGLVSGSLNNVTLGVALSEFDASHRPIADDAGYIVPPTSLTYTSQPNILLATTTKSGCAFVSPMIIFRYSVGNAIDLTVRLSAPSLDNGTQWKGTFTRGDGSSAILAWDSGGGSTLSGLADTYTHYQDDAGKYHLVVGNSIMLTGSPVWITRAPKR